MPHQSGTSVVLATLRRMLLVVFVCMLALTACRKGNDTTNQAPTATSGSSGEESSGNNTGGNQPTGSSGQNAELPAPGILVSAVTGNTAALNAVAEFSVQLDSVPTADVTISVASSNEGEGVAQNSRS